MRLAPLSLTAQSPFCEYSIDSTNDGGRWENRGRSRRAASANSRRRTSSGACGCTGSPSLVTTGIGPVISVSDSGGTSGSRTTCRSGRWGSAAESFGSGVGVSGARVNFSPPFVAGDPTLIGANRLVGLGLLSDEQLVEQLRHLVGDHVQAPRHLGLIRLVPSARSGAAQGKRRGVEPLLRGGSLAVGGGELVALGLDAGKRGMRRADSAPLPGHIGRGGHRDLLPW